MDYSSIYFDRNWWALSDALVFCVWKWPRAISYQSGNCISAKTCIPHQTGVAYCLSLSSDSLQLVCFFRWYFKVFEFRIWNMKMVYLEYHVRIRLEVQSVYTVYIGLDWRFVGMLIRKKRRLLMCNKFVLLITGLRYELTV